MYLSEIKWVVYSMASNGIIDFDGKQIYVPEWALDDSVQTLVGISQSILNNLAKQTKTETDGQDEQRKSNTTNARLLRDISNNTAESKRSNEDFRENSKRLMATFTSSRNSFVATQNAMDSLTNLSSNLGSRIEELRGKVADTGLSFESYSSLIVKNNDVMKRFGTDLVDGSNNFAALSKRIRESIGDSAKYGVSVETLNQMILDEIDVRIRSGKTQEEINNELSTGFRRTIDTITALSVATDTAVGDIVNATNQLKSSDAVRTFIEAGTLESRRLEELLPGLTAIFSSLGDVGDTLVTGIVESVAANTDVMAYQNGRIADILNTGGTELADNFVTLVDFMKTALSSGIQGVEEADLATTVLSNLSSGLAIMGEEVSKNKDILEAASKAGNKNAEQLVSLGVATQRMSQNFTMFSRTLATAQTEVTETFDKINEAANRPPAETETPGWLASFLSRQIARPDSEGKPPEVGTLPEEMSKFIDRFNRMADNREQYKLFKILIGGISTIVSSTVRGLSSLIREDLAGAVTSLVDGVGRFLSSIPLVGGLLGAAASGVSFALGTVVGATEEYAKVMQSMIGVGAGIGSSLEVLRSQAGRLGVDLQALANVVSSNSKAMLAFGTGVNEGSRNFLAMAETVKSNTSGMRQYGFSNTELLEILAEEADVRRLSGQTVAGLDAGMDELLFQTTAVANLTGIQRRELLRERQKQAAGGLVSAYTATLDPDTAEKFKSISATIGAISPGAMGESLIKSIISGFDITVIPEMADMLGSMPPQMIEMLKQIVADARSGLFDPSVTANEVLAKAITSLGSMAKTFDPESMNLIQRTTLGDTGAQRVLSEITAIRGLPTEFAEAIAKIEETRKNIKETEELELIPAIQDLAQAMKTSVLLTAMDIFGFESGKIVENLVKMEEMFKGDKPGEVKPILDVVRTLSDQIVTEDNLKSAIDALVNAISSPTGGLIAAVLGLSVALKAYTIKNIIQGVLGAGGISTPPPLPGPGSRLSRFTKSAGKAAGRAAMIAVPLTAYDLLQTYQDEEMTPEQKTEEYSAAGGGLLGALAGGAIAGGVAGSVFPGLGNLAGALIGAAGATVGYIGGEMFGRWLGEADNPEISGGAGDAEVAGSAGTDTLGTTITQTTEELMLASQLNSRLDSLLTKYDEEIEILKTQNQILIDTMARVMETNRILENYVRVYKENVM